MGLTYGHQGARAVELTVRLVCKKDVTLQYTFLAISPVFGLVYHTTQVGARTGALFHQFLKNTNEPLDENETHYHIFDDAPAHRGAISPADNTKIQVLPPYSPFLSSVEQAISCLKANNKADITRPRFQNQINDRNAAHDQNAHIPLGEYRKRVLVTAA